MSNETLFTMTESDYQSLVNGDVAFRVYYAQHLTKKNIIKSITSYYENMQESVYSGNNNRYLFVGFNNGDTSYARQIVIRSDTHNVDAIQCYALNKYDGTTAGCVPMKISLVVCQSHF